MIKVLVVDDEPQILRALWINLRARGYVVEVAAGGTQALRVAATHQPELVVLDLGLPDLDGLDVIHGLRGWTAVPIIVLSGRSGSSDKVAALDAGADDYVTKPFGVYELLAHIRAPEPQSRSAGGRSSSPTGPEPREADQPTPAVAGSLGTAIRERDQLPYMAQLRSKLEDDPSHPVTCSPNPAWAIDCTSTTTTSSLTEAWCRAQLLSWRKWPNRHRS